MREDINFKDAERESDYEKVYGLRGFQSSVFKYVYINVYDISISF